MSGVPVEVSARRITVPYLCPCCCGVADAALAVSFTRVTGKQRVRETTRELDFPYCSRCVRHARWWSSARRAAVLVMVCGAVAALGTAVGVSPLAGAGIAAGAAAVAAVAVLALWTRARATCSAACTGPGPAVTYHGWVDNVQRFSFASRRYAAAFAEQNEHSLVNVTPHLYQLVEQHRVEAAPTVEPEPETGSDSKPWPSAPRLKAPTAPQPIMRAKSSSTQPATRSRASTSAPPLTVARSRASTSAPPLTVARSRASTSAPPLTIARSRSSSTAPTLAVVRTRAASTAPPLTVVRTRAASTAPPPATARSRASTTAPPPMRAARTRPPGSIAEVPQPEPRPAEEEAAPMWPERVDRGRSLLENVMRIDARTIQSGGLVKRPGRVS
jgi:hypothetical protein